MIRRARQNEIRKSDVGVDQLGDFPVVIRLKGGTGATPESIIYVWRNGKRYCEHAYLLTTELKPIDVNPVKDWEVADEDEKPKMFARVSWPI